MVTKKYWLYTKTGSGLIIVVNDIIHRAPARLSKWKGKPLETVIKILKNKRELIELIIHSRKNLKEYIFFKWICQVLPKFPVPHPLLLSHRWIGCHAHAIAITDMDRVGMFFAITITGMPRLSMTRMIIFRITNEPQTPATGWHAQVLLSMADRNYP